MKRNFHPMLSRLTGIDPPKIGPIRDFFFAEKGLYVLVENELKYYGASSTINPPKTGSNEGNTRTLITLSDDFLLLKNVIFSPLKEQKSLTTRARPKKRQFLIPYLNPKQNNRLAIFIFHIFFIQPQTCITLACILKTFSNPKKKSSSF